MEKPPPKNFRFPFENRFFSDESINSNERIIFHYTSAAGALGILTSRRIRLGSIEFMNDEAELKHAVGFVGIFADQLLREGDSRVREAFKAQYRVYRDRTDLPAMYVACFTEANDLLSQWRGYTPSSGYALGMSLEGLREVAVKQNMRVDPVAYEYEAARSLLKPSLEKLLASVDVTLDPAKEEDFQKIFQNFSKLFEDIYAKCILIKNEGFSEEREWRIYSLPWTDYRPLMQVVERRGELSPVLGLDLYRSTEISQGREFHDICFRTWRTSPGANRQRRSSSISQLVSQLNLKWTVGGQSMTPLRS